MTTANIVNEIQRGLSLSRSQDSIDVIKRAVMESLSSVDDSVEIQNTDYFNHAFAPDFVLNWPGRTAAERGVYLRFNDDPAWITNELSTLDEKRPVIYGLSPTSEGVEAQKLDEASSAGHTLVTDPSGVNQLAQEDNRSGMGAVLRHGLLRGGRGLVNDEGAVRVEAALNGGFASARQGDPVGIGTAILETEKTFLPSQAGQVVGFLNAIWTASKHDPELFPESNTPPAKLAADALDFLLSYEEIDDYSFWRLVGEDLDLDRLGQLNLPNGSRNLNHLVRTNLDRIWARGCRVVPDQRRLGDPTEALRWRIDRNLLALSGDDFTAYLATAADRLEGVPSEPASGVSFADIVQRSESVSIDSFELSNGNRVVKYASEDQSDVSHDDELQTMSTTLGTAHVTKATVQTGGRTLEVDFTKRTIQARTGGKPFASALLATGLPLLWPLVEEDAVALSTLLVRSTPQASLFD